MIKEIKKFFILFFFCCFVTLMGAEREIPHTIVKENPEKEVTEIQTLKKYKEKAELNITVTKIKTEELPVQVDRNRKKIFAKLENVEGEEIQAIEKPEDIPDPETVEGRKALNKNRSRRGKRSVSDSNLETERYDITAGEKRTKLEINYRNLPKDLYIAVTDKNTRKLKKLYKANYADYRATYGNDVNVKLWLFGEEVEALSNVVLDYSNNSTGDIALRSNGQYSSPEDVIIKSGLHTAFNMDKELVNEEFEDNDTINIENKGGEVSGIRSNQGNFYTTRNKYGELKIPGFKVKARIWSNCPKFELSLEKDGMRDGYAKFDVIHKDSNNRTRQTIHVEIFVNNKPFKEYFKTDAKAYRQKIDSYPPYQNISEEWKTLNDPGIEVKGFYTDSLEIYKKEDAEIERIFGEASYEPVEKFPFSNGGSLGFYPMGSNVPVTNYEVKDFKINQVLVYLNNNWLLKKDQTYQIFILRDALQFKYAERKREIPVELNFGFYTQNWQETNQDITGKMSGIPIVGENLTKSMYNGGRVIDFDYNKEAFVVHRNMKTPNKRILIETEEGETLADCYDSKNLDGTIFKYKAVELKLNRVELGKVEEGKDDDYRHYYFSIEKMNLTNSERILKISGSSTDGYKYNKTTNIITIPKFLPKNLINNDNTSLKGEVIRYVDVSNSNISDSLFVNLGEFHFKYYKDMTILRTNMSESPYIELPDSAWLELEGNDSIRIPVTLSFDRNSDEKKLEMDNFNNSSKAGGGNGKVVYLKILPEDYKKLKKQGGGVTYTLVADIEIKTDINKTPVNEGPPARKQDEKLQVNVKIKTIEATANEATIEFQEKKPLYKNGFFKFLDKQVTPETEKIKGTIYADTVKLRGKVPGVKGTGKEHKYELIDGDGGVHRGIIRKGGTGGYWESVDIGNNSRANISQGKGGVTYIALTGWNYGGSNGTVSIKHYEENSESILQYYIFNFIVPKFDPYIYYNENGDSRIKKFEKKEVNFPVSEEKNILLGEIKTQDYNMEITKDGRDSEGLRIEGNTSVDILDATTNDKVGTGKIVIKETGSSASVDKIIGRNKTAEVYLQFPDSSLDKTKEYIVKSSYTSGDDISDKKYILRIGRNGYFKELIQEIKIGGKKELVKGSATINVAREYNLKDSGILKSLKDPSKEKLSFETQVTGITLSDEQGSGFIELNPTDKLEISVNGSTSIKVLKDKAEEVSLSKNKMKVEIKDNKVHISFPVVQLGESQESSFNLKVIDSAGKEKGEYDFKVVFPKNYLRIISVENMDFGRAVPGISGYKATGRVHIETTVTMEKIEVTKDKTEVEMTRVNNSTDKLVAKISSGTLGKEEVEADKKYKYELMGELDVPRNTLLGEYKGNLQITVSIRE